MQKAYAANRIFTGKEWLYDQAIVVEKGLIRNILPRESVEAEDFGDSMIVPGFIDLQVYGAAGKLLAVYPSASTLEIMNDTFLASGTVGFLPTVATNTIPVFKKCIDAVREYWKIGGTGVLGLHLEGPWLNPEKRGAHVKEWIHRPEISEVKDLLEYGKEVVKMITIAPEVCSGEIIEFIINHGIILSAGHSNATEKEASASFKKGVQAVTHLYNAMSPLHHREPGLVGAAFMDNEVMASIIPDGHHVDFQAVSIAKKIMGSRLFAITDAVAETSLGPYQHQQAGDKFECNGVLSGSALSMHKAFANLVNRAGIEIDEALRMCSLYPAMVLNCSDQYGRIAPGYKGQFVVLNNQLEVVCVITS